MKAIKLRAWAESRKLMITEKMLSNRYLSFDGKEVLIQSEGMECFGGGYNYRTEKVDSIMQCTGLKDKNGVEIYEGDILDFDEREWGGKFQPEVVPTIDKLIGDWGMHGSPADVSEWRAVIGNIHQNPELLS